MKTLATLFLLLFVGCATARVSTPEERTTAEAILTTVETGITAAHGLGEITPAQFALATSQLAELRQIVAESETTPTTWATVYQRVLNFAAQWALLTAARKPS